MMHNGCHSLAAKAEPCVTGNRRLGARLMFVCKSSRAPQQKNMLFVCAQHSVQHLVPRLQSLQMPAAIKGGTRLPLP
jgi:hypothetical protein